MSNKNKTYAKLKKPYAEISKAYVKLNKPCAEINKAFLNFNSFLTSALAIIQLTFSLHLLK
jgi:hypothetical protein